MHQTLCTEPLPAAAVCCHINLFPIPQHHRTTDRRLHHGGPTVGNHVCFFSWKTWRKKSYYTRCQPTLLRCYVDNIPGKSQIGTNTTDHRPPQHQRRDRTNHLKITHNDGSIEIFAFCSHTPGTTAGDGVDLSILADIISWYNLYKHVRFASNNLSGWYRGGKKSDFSGLF